MKNNLRFINALLTNNAKEIKLLYQDIFPRVKRFILQNKGSEADAKDIFQKALLQLTVRYRKEPFEITSSFEGYLFGVCKNLWRRELNKSRNWVTTDKIIEPEDESQDRALAALEQERRELFKEHFQNISDSCKKVLLLFFEKISYEDIVEKLNYGSQTVARQRIFKCKKKLTEMIQADKRYNSLKEL